MLKERVKRDLKRLKNRLPARSCLGGVNVTPKPAIKGPIGWLLWASCFMRPINHQGRPPSQETYIYIYTYI